MGNANSSISNDLARAGAWPWSLVLGFSVAWLLCAIYAFSHIEIDMLWHLGLFFFGVIIAFDWIVMTLMEIFIRFKQRAGIS